ncbi:MAG: HAMP domain-containing protein [Verrucomicrobia bacterium]|nr:HAMP domain-containing protein [Verrucomicrobiota bacterium]
MVGLYAAALFPQQRQDALDALASKANSITLFLQELSATALVTEDYTAVVDQCTTVIRGDAEIDFIVLARSDGFTLVHDRQGWHTEKLDRSWRSGAPEPHGEIGEFPPLPGRAYRYSRPLEYGGIPWGRIHVGLSLHAHDEGLRRLLRHTLAFAAGAMALAFGAAYLNARLLFSPLLKLQAVVGRVARGDLAARAENDRQDELGQLARSVNGMTEAIQTRDRNLQEANLRLEERVEARTRELREQKDAAERAHRDLAETQRRLFEASRLAGMAQVATGILHNVGNVLNSVNVSANIVRDELAANPHLGLLDRTAALLRERGAEAPRFIAEDPRGRHVPGLIVEIGAGLQQCRADLTRELSSLSTNIDHIRQIVAVQQDYTKAGGLTQTFDPAELFADAQRIARASLQRHQVVIEQDYPPERPLLSTDRHLALQIVVNLVQNAIDAVKTRPAPDRRVTLRLTVAAGRVRLAVCDNGVGIAPEDIARLFQHGYTTRKDGHGFGLHSGALAAANLGGTLRAASDGRGLGATFTLELPLVFTPPAAP